jgi:REP element-mobilizing transposase RayT
MKESTACRARTILFVIITVVAFEAEALVSKTENFHRRSIRLKSYDYGSVGAYFITICAWKNECLFGSTGDGKIHLTSLGTIVEEEWLRTADLRANVRLDEYVIMPNHFHAIIWLTSERTGTEDRSGKSPTDGRGTPTDGRGTACRAHPNFAIPAEKIGQPIAGTLPTIIRAFKSAVTVRVNKTRNSPGPPVWQRNYFERVVRDEEELHRFREYILLNPERWEEDKENPEKEGTARRAPTMNHPQSEQYPET